MDTVLILGNGTCSLSRLSAGAKSISVLDSFSGSCAPLAKSLESVDSAVSFLQSLFDPERVKADRFFVIFAPGSGIAYKTWQTALVSVKDVSDKTSTEREDRVLAHLMENLPDGLTELYDRYTPSLVSCYEDDTAVLSACYIPTVFLENLKGACESLGISLFKVSDVTSSLKNIIDTEYGEVFVRVPGMTAVFNEFGTMSWIMSEEPSDEMVSLFASLTEKFFPLENTMHHSEWTDLDHISQFLSVDITSKEGLPLGEAVIAAGCTVPASLIKRGKKPIGDAKVMEEGGDKESVIGQLRKLFKKK